MIRYVVTTLPDGRANLSRSGNWGNLPHDSPEAAREAARIDAAGAEFKIEQVALRRQGRGKANGR